MVKEKKRREIVNSDDEAPSAEIPEEDANVEDCATLQEAREYYNFVKKARCDEYATFMLGDLKQDNESIEELAGKLKRARPTWYSPKCSKFGAKNLEKIVEKIMEEKICIPGNLRNVAGKLNHDLSDSGSPYRVKYLKDFFVVPSGEDRIVAVVAC